MSEESAGLEAALTPPVVILTVGRRLAEMLGVDEQEARAIIAAQATRARATPSLVPLMPDAGRLTIGEGFMIFSAALVALVRGRANAVDGHAAEIGAFLGLATGDQQRVVRPVQRSAASAPALPAAQALALYFNPEPAVKALAKKLIAQPSPQPARRPISHILPSDYEHPDDRAGLAAVRSVSGMELALRKVSELGVEKVHAIENLAGCIRVGAKQFPELYALFVEAVKQLGMPRVPELYVKQMPPNAYTVGIDSPRVVLSYALPALFTRDELLFVIGHELGHIRSGHAPFAMLRHVLPQLAELVGQATLGIGALLGMGMQAALLDWYRKSEMTCDRCGLLVCQDSDAALSALMKLAGAPTVFYRQLNLDAFIAQADDYDKLDTSILSKLYKFGNALENDHPWPAVRARELVRWVRAGEYARLLDGAVPAKGPACSGCGTALTRDDVFCSDCGTRVAAR